MQNNQAQTLNLPELTCLRCGHIWIPRSNEYPTVCPKCKSPYWDKKRKDNNEGNNA